MLVAYTLEILPYKIRARGFAVMVCSLLFLCIVHKALTGASEFDGLFDICFQSVRQSSSNSSARMVVLLGIRWMALVRAYLRCYVRR